MGLSFNEWVEVDGCGAMPLNLLTFMEQLDVVAVNDIPPVAHDPVGGLFEVILNGQTFTPVDGSFLVGGRTISWLSPVYDVNPGDDVVAVYSYMG